MAGTLVVDVSKLLNKIDKIKRDQDTNEVKAFSVVGAQAVKDIRAAMRSHAPPNTESSYIGGFKRKKSRPTEFMEQITRWSFARRGAGIKGSNIRFGIFAGTRTGAGTKYKRTLTNAAFKKRFGVTVARMGKILTEGGKLKITPEHRREMLRAAADYKAGRSHRKFHFLNPNTQYIQFKPVQWSQVFSIKKLDWQNALHREILRRIGMSWLGKKA